MTTGPKMVISLVGTFVVSAVVVAAAGAVIAQHVERRQAATPSASPRALRWEPGACVRDSGPRYELASCEDARAEVVAMAADPPGLGDCPDDTDDVLRVGQGRTACVRGRAAPHPGAPGAGGGVLRAGDCLAADGRERPCTPSGWYGKAVAVVTAASACPAGTVDALTLDERATACLGAGGQVLAEGMCVARPPERVVDRSAIAAIPCASPGAWARVSSFESAGTRCPKGSDRYLRARGAFRPVTCLSVLDD